MSELSPFKTLCLIKKGHKHLIRYQPGDEKVVLGVLIEKADSPDCDLDWFDAAVLSHQMGKEAAVSMQALLKEKLSP